MIQFEKSPRLLGFFGVAALLFVLLSSIIDCSEESLKNDSSNTHIRNGESNDRLTSANLRIPRVSMTLRRGHLQTFPYMRYYQCSPENDPLRYMHSEMQNAPGILDFTAFLSSDLKILVMGDSVGNQFSKSLEELFGGALPGVGVAEGDADSAAPQRTVYRYTKSHHEGLHISAPVRNGGGVLAGWRILGMLRKEGLTQELPNRGTGWRMEDVHRITNHTYYDQQGQKQQVGSYDVLFFHIPVGWILDYEKDVSDETLMETVRLAGDLFGVKTVIFSVPPFNNNILNAEHFTHLRLLQERVRRFAELYSPSKISDSAKATTVQQVLSLHLDRFMDETMEWNARLMGMNVTTSGYAEKITDDDWRLAPLDAIHVQTGKPYQKHVAQLCSVLPDTSNENRTCTRKGMFSYDGQHLCMNYVGGRIFAGFGCLLDCVYNKGLARGHDLNACADKCNDRYLTLTSVAGEIVD